MPRRRKKIIDVASAIVLLALIMLDATMWRDIFDAVRSIGANNSAAREYVLPVTRASSTLLILPGGGTMLVDAAPDDAIVDDLQKTLPQGAPAYIDLAIIAAPEPNDYEGYQYLLQHYAVGAFIYNGRADGDHDVEWAQLISAITEKHIPMITVGAGDRIRWGASGAIIITAPDVAHAHSPNASDTAIFLLYNK